MAIKSDPFVEALHSTIEAKIKAYVVAAHRPQFVNQRTVTAVVGMPGEDFLEHGRDGDFQTWKDHRLVYAHTDDVVAFIHGRPVAPCVANDLGDDSVARALTRAGANRVVR